MLNVIKQKEFWIMVALFIGTLVLMITDPFNLNPEGLEGTTVWVALYVIPAIVTWYLIFKKPTDEK